MTRERVIQHLKFHFVFGAGFVFPLCALICFVCSALPQVFLGGVRSVVSFFGSNSSDDIGVVKSKAIWIYAREDIHFYSKLLFLSWLLFQGHLSMCFFFFSILLYLINLVSIRSPCCKTCWLQSEVWAKIDKFWKVFFLGMLVLLLYGLLYRYISYLISTSCITCCSIATKPSRQQLYFLSFLCMWDYILLKLLLIKLYRIWYNFSTFNMLLICQYRYS